MNIVLERWSRRLLNWSYYKLGSGDNRGVNSAYDGEYGEGAPRPPLPLVGDAQDVDALIWKLSNDHRQAVHVVYIWSVPPTLGERAALIGIHRDTLSDRLREAKFRLEDLDNERHRSMVRPPVQPTAPPACQESASNTYHAVSANHALLG